MPALLFVSHWQWAESGVLSDHVARRYDSFDSGDGARFELGELGLVQLRDLAAAGGEPESRSGRQEWCENIINQYL